MYAEINIININLLNKKDDSLLFQLRTGHLRLNRNNPNRVAHCRNCHLFSETVKPMFLKNPGLKS